MRDGSKSTSYKGHILASCSSEGALSPEFRKRPRREVDDLFSDDGDDRWRGDWEVLSKAELAHYRKLRGY